ncbi:Cycloisomaltooligosaccharide glucanotransferase [Frankliniella fusca]|uniref:Cycloisomaltooligosaccharide glucanotransferase n=1 Tax=Frankliniella fusca TaxID=407009 RepID=A0AAE1GWC5_9NEOP|nr:Cycloisomaltooligosaccharide glucanotransferase [Frankliniella fusca]
MDSAKQKVKTDVERQFEEDLERARALSLESLALEQFRKCKQQRELEKLNESQKLFRHNASVSARRSEIHERKLSAPQTSNNNSVHDRLELKSRPRPGSFNSGATKTTPILAPPPTARRISVTTTESAKDLISFTSPECNEQSLYSDLDELCGSLSRQISKDDSMSNDSKEIFSSSTPRLSRSNSSVSSFGTPKQLSHENSPITIPTISHSQSDSLAMRALPTLHPFRSLQVHYLHLHLSWDQQCNCTALYKK